MTKLSDKWQTPQWLFDELNKEFNFDIDLCASFDNRKVETFYEDYVCLLPNTIKTCKYMDILDENGGKTPFRKWKLGIEIRDLSRRTNFCHPNKESSSPSFGCMIVIMDRRII